MRRPGLPAWPTIRLLWCLAIDVILAGPGWIIITLGAQVTLVINPQLTPDPLAILRDPLFVLSYPAVLVLTLSGVLVLVATIVFWHHDLVVRPPREQATPPPGRLLVLGLSRYYPSSRCVSSPCLPLRPRRASCSAGPSTSRSCKH